MLFDSLAANRALWTLGDESHRQIEGIPELHPAAHDFASNALSAADATAEVARALREAFAKDLRNADGTRLLELGQEQLRQLRFLEKTPKNALRIPFLRAVFPDALFIYLHRNPRDNISSIMDAWRSGRFVTYPQLPDWDGPPWSLLLIPGWQELRGAPVAEIAARQWRDTNLEILSQLSALPASQWCSVRHESVLADPARELRRLCRFANLPFGDRMMTLTAGELKPSRYTLSRPDPEKWRKNADELEPVLPSVDDVAARLTSLSEEPAADRVTGGAPAALQSTL